MISRWPTLFFCSLLILLVSCKGNDADTLLDYTETAQLTFEDGMEQFEDGDCPSADQFFDEVRRKFPYSRFAVLAELRIADCQFQQGNEATAAVSYQQFVKAHPTHVDAHYAAYQRGVCYHEMIPGDYGITPPPHERDQSATRDARSVFASFIKNYPTSEWVEQSKKYLSDVEDQLVRHEMYVAEFYLSREDRRAAAVRLEGVRKNFPQSSLVPDAMFMQAVTFLELDQQEEARRVFEEIINHFPDHYQSRRATDYLETLDIKKRGSNG